MTLWTHKVVLGAQPLGAVLLQQTFQKLPAGVGHVGLQHGGLVQDVVVHLGRVAAVERWLRKPTRNHLDLPFAVVKPLYQRALGPTDLRINITESIWIPLWLQDNQGTNIGNNNNSMIT